MKKALDTSITIHFPLLNPLFFPSTPSFYSNIDEATPGAPSPRRPHRRPGAAELMYISCKTQYKYIIYMYILLSTSDITTIVINTKARRRPGAAAHSPLSGPPPPAPSPPPAPVDQCKFKISSEFKISTLGIDW